MAIKGKILSVNISEKKGTIKLPVKEIIIGMQGVEDDAHAGNWLRQVSLLGKESFDKFSVQAGRSINYGEFAENITTEGIVLYKAQPLDYLVAGDAELEITQIGKKCHGDNCAIFREVGNCLMPVEGIFCRVIKPGILRPGMQITIVPRVFKIMVITLSDRASQGMYEDKSGPRIRELLEADFKEKYWQYKFRYEIIADDESCLKNLLRDALFHQFDMVFTTGGTGIGPRDITPEGVRSVITKEIPGIMEMIRLKYGQEKPNALLSRSVAGVAGSALVYALPGSVRAVNEYMQEIIPTLKHSIYILHGLDEH